MLQEHDKHAVISLAVRLITYHSQNTADRANLDEIAKRIGERESVIVQLEGGLRAIGYDVTADGVWPSIIDLYGDELKAILSPDHQNYEDTEPNQKITQIPLSPPSGTIAQLCLEKLREAGARGLKAITIRDWLKSAHNIDTHYKTVGMTLYRLSQESPPKVHRRGHTWFFGPSQNEQKTPGGDVPGDIYDTSESEIKAQIGKRASS